MGRSVIYQDIHQEGKIAGRTEDLLSILSVRFKVSEEVEGQIRGIKDEARLRDLLIKAAVQAKDWDEFVNVLPDGKGP